MSYYRSSQFNQLKAHWYQILKEQGFDDIEQLDERHQANYLKNLDSTYFQKRYTQLTFEAKQEYYQLAGRFLEVHRFRNYGEKLIWGMHTAGYGLRDIAKNYGLSHETIAKIVRRLAKQMRRRYK